ncbi:response regulator transcription factor [Shewanella frigidimarina]|jgi:two-component system response regulator CpxR|uniref:response regulator transcription factor n=2 Tax=Shewanellaceae TaxID=267890 RepID=UPI000F5061CE|nr:MULTISPECIES: response regulator transcription factor [Shewanella]MBB1424946.1 response regulator transcription factor [Shewanella sp. SG44-2]RPA33917.1 DNA-binding response regulator [Shewanella frigidimarina]|tara:strand:- start:3074 stop:3736 length:663 start_codon:yes stop_codon:yes gene_type:complete
MKNILFIEHTLSDKSDVGRQLNEQGYSVHWVNNAFDALIQMETLQLEAILLDFSVPKMDSFWLLVARQSRTPIIVLAESNSELERINALELGADDYLTRPINIRELQLRLNVLHRRTQAPINDAVNGSIGFDDTSYTISFADKSLVLTQTEYRLFKYLFDRQGEVVTKEELQLRVLHKELGRFDRNLDMHISNTRRKLVKRNLPRELINTVRGQGYSFSF